MQIVHDRKRENRENSPFSITYGDKATDNTLLNLEKNLLMQMGSVLSIVHGGEYKRRRTHLSA